MSLIEVKLYYCWNNSMILWNKFKHFQQSSQFLIEMIYDSFHYFPLTYNSVDMCLQ
jgi:hypothetical protein